MLLFSTALTSMAFGQMEPFLLLEKPGNMNSRERFYVGNEIRWTFHDEKTVNVAVIASLSDSSFTTTDAITIWLHEIDEIHIPKGGGVKKFSAKAFYAIPPMILFSAANNAFNTGRTPLVDEEVWWISGIFAGISALSYLIPDSKKMQMDKRWRLIAIIH